MKNEDLEKLGENISPLEEAEKDLLKGGFSLLKTRKVSFLVSGDKNKNCHQHESESEGEEDDENTNCYGCSSCR